MTLLPFTIRSDGTADAPRFPFYSRLKDTSPAKVLNLSDLLALSISPDTGPKEQAACLTPFNATGKTTEHASAAPYWALVVDHDDDNRSREEIEALYNSWGCAWLAFTSASHQQEKKGVIANRWKVVIPLAAPIDSTRYGELCLGLALLNGTDEAQTRAAQVFFAPNRLHVAAPFDSIDQTERPLLDATTNAHPLAGAAVERLHAAQDAKAAKAKTQPAKPRSVPVASASVIDMANAAYDLASVIEANGYKRIGRAWLSPQSGTGTPGVHILQSPDGRQRLYSHHGPSDPLSSLNHDGHALDVFDVLLALEYGGDLSRAVADLANQLDAAGQKERQREHMAKLEAERGEEETRRALEALQDYSDPVFTPAERGRVVLPAAIRATELGKLAARVSHCLEFPEASALLALLAGASAAVATSYAVQYASGTAVPAGIYAVLEQPPAMQKSRLLSHAQVPYLRAMGAHNSRVWKFNEGQKRDAPKAHRGFTVVTDATSAGLDMRLATCAEGRFFIASAEQAAFQSLFPENADFATHNGLLLQGWAGEYVETIRKGRQGFSGIASGAVLVIAQPGSAQRVFSASNGTGLAERFFYLSEPTPLGNRTLHGERVTQSELAAFDTACRACVNDYSDRSLSPGGVIGPAQEPERLRQLRATAEGYALLLQARRDIEPTLGELARTGELLQVGWLGKIETHTLKVAAVLHVVECLGNGCTVPAEIPAQTIRTALEFVRVLGSHLADLLHDSGETGEVAEIDAVIELAISKPRPVRVLAQALRKRHPFRAMGKQAYGQATARIRAMLGEGRLVLNAKGEVVPT